jgi:hypothetical protein
VFNALIKSALTLIVIVGTSASSLAQSPVGTPNGGSAGAGISAISGIPPGPANADGLNNSIADPSGIRNALKIAAPPPPIISVPKVPTFQ